MANYAALLRAINVGGTGKLAMSELITLCKKAGFESPKTFIQSGNVVFKSKLSEAKVKATLQAALHKKLGKECLVLVRTDSELADVIARNPFTDAPPNRVLVFFLDEAPNKSVLKDTKTLGGEVLALSGRELFVHFPNGQGQSKLKIPFADISTGRNFNSVSKLAALAHALDT